MASSVGTRPNHYEVLGLLPTASEDEIAQAFAKAMGVFGARPLSDVAQLSAAFETLRDPAKRRAYDDELGRSREPEPEPAAVTGYWTVASAHAGAPSFIGSQWTKPRVDAPAPDAEPEMPPQLAEAKPRPELDLPTFLAASRRALPVSDPVEHRLDAAPQIDDSWQWKRPALAVGALLLAAGGVGVVAGLSAGGEVEDEAGLTVALPAAKAHAKTAASAPVVLAKAIETPAVANRAAGPSAVRDKPLASPQPVAVAAEQAVERDPLAPVPIDSAFVESATTQAAATEVAPPAQATPASMPLPGRVVARTIDRIGYACGSVASTAAVDGARGVFKVTCSSGQSYRAAPVHGRYRFSRWQKD